MMKIRTYIQDGSNLAPIDQYTGSIDNPNHIEGAIDLEVDGTLIIDTEMWDYVDQLWLILISGAEHLIERKHLMGYFPDQPIEIVFKDLNDEFIELRVDSSVALVDRSEFLSVLLAEAEQFFRKLSELIGDSNVAESAIERISLIRTRSKGQTP
jgi:hypothetical protein